MAEPLLRLKGFSELKNTFKKLPANVQKRVIVNANAAGAREIAKQARKNAPVRRTGGPKKRYDRHGKFTGVITQPGNLKKNIVVRRTGKRKLQFAVSHTIAPRGFAYYGLFLEAEYGGKNKHPRPWLRPALQVKAGAAVNAIRVRIRKGLAKELRKLRAMR